VRSISWIVPETGIDELICEETKEGIEVAVARLRFLSSDEEELVHEKSLEVLSEIGVLVRSESVLSLLEDSGANVDKENRIARIPEGVVGDALKSAPTNFKMCARDRTNDIEVPTTGAPYLTTDGLTLYMIDIETSEKRNATRVDFAEFARLADALDAVDFFWPIVTISDVPLKSHNLYELWTAFQNCSLHVQGDCTDAISARRMIELASLVVGGQEELRRRPIFSCATNPISPLSFDKGAVEAQIEFARAGIPVLCHSMSMSGMSAPVTLAGTIVNLNAENLASIVISQNASRGAPHIYGSCSMPADMMTGTINLYAPEGVLISAAAGQMARRYRRPCMVANWGLGGKGPGIQVSLSEAFAYNSSAFSGSDLISGIGGLDHAKGCSLDQMVLDSIVWDSFRAFLRDFTIDDGTAALDVMRQVGHGNSYLSHAHTGKTFRKELEVWDRSNLSLEATLSSKMLPQARSIAKKLLKEHEVPPLDRDILRRGELLLKATSREG
jgi:trimethylamine--corrinoid protein Co-methyltransferase